MKTDAAKLVLLPPDEPPPEQLRNALQLLRLAHERNREAFVGGDQVLREILVAIEIRVARAFNAIAGGWR